MGIAKEKKKDRIINRHKKDRKRISSMVVLKNRKLKRKKQQNKENIKSLLKHYLGSKDAVTEHKYLKKRSFVYKCPECVNPNFISEKLNRHLQSNHQKSWKEALMIQSRMRILYLWCNGNKHARHLPVPCEPCGEWYSRLDNHLKSHRVHRELKADERADIVLKMKDKYWAKGVSSKISQEPCSSRSAQQDFNRNSTEDFKRRSKVKRSSPSQLPQSALDYIPSNSIRITPELQVKWNVMKDDYLDIYFENADSLLEQFQSELEGSGHDRQNAVQHRNSVELIWISIDKSPTMFPVNGLCNVHLFRDFYHRPNFLRIGREDGVQASTLRARYVSLGFFFQFLRKYQIFAGINRKQMDLIEKSVEDFNKELNPLIKQRKVDVREEKRKNLLTSDHFVRYGRSNFVQKLIKTSKNNLTKIFSKQFCINFRDYLITSLVIGNGLRASNILELRIKDVDNATVAEGYEGHKIITNNKYKTSTIYGEKFVVVSDSLYNQLRFYLNRLRPQFEGSSSSRLFVPTSGSLAMTQTNISSSLTASFKNAAILKAAEYQRVSCTRIRCALATFACNDGGFEMGYFANHFMKNKEETTALHYNLLSNRRHALSIAMKLYDSFSCINGEVKVDSDIAEKVAKDIKEASSKLDKANVIQWLTSHDPGMTKQELVDFSDALEESASSNFSSSKSKYFYSEKTEEVCLSILAKCPKNFLFFNKYGCNHLQ